MTPNQYADQVFEEPDGRVWVNPLTFKDDELYVILIDDRRGFFGWGIKHHTRFNYSHIAIAHKPGMCASQDLSGFKVKPITDYMNDTTMIKFWGLRGMTELERSIVLDAIQARVNRKWWQKTYDYFGLVGQFFGLTWFQNPWQAFCSEQVNEDFTLRIPRLIRTMNLYKPSPGGIDQAFSQHLDVMYVRGYYWR